MFELDEFAALREKYHMKILVSPQCMFGASTTKPTAWLHANCDLSGWPDACCHQPTWHWNDSLRKSHYSPHPWAIGFLKEGGFRSTQAASYPPDLNRELARALVIGVHRHRALALTKADLHAPKPKKFRRVGGKWNSIARCTAADEARDFADKKFSFSSPLKDRDTLQQNTRQADGDNAKCVGGLARAYTAVLKCPTLATVGQSILEVLEPIIARRESEMNACLDSLGTEDCPVPPEDLGDGGWHE